jgi:hypothetical protein
MTTTSRKPLTFFSITYAARSCEVSYMTIRNAYEAGELEPDAVALDGQGRARPLWTSSTLDLWLARRRA